MLSDEEKAEEYELDCIVDVYEGDVCNIPYAYSGQKLEKAYLDGLEEGRKETCRIVCKEICKKILNELNRMGSEWHQTVEHIIKDLGVEV